MLNDKPLHKIHLGFGPALTRTVFVRAKRRDIAERRALRRNPGAHIVKSPFPQNER
jgi:hypothetical protein